MMSNYVRVTCAFLVVLILSSCGAYYNQPTTVSRARLGEDTYMTNKLRNLPGPQEPIYAAVYKFRDQTGQYRPSQQGTNWSTAVTQGATNILIRALENSKWFIPVERENVSNLLNERKIIRSSREQYAQGNNNNVGLPPLLFAGIILEGGIVSYDANLVTGGVGARYFGAGGSARYRQDRVSIYLRAISTQNGRILKTVYISKTILSQALDGGIFRFVSFQRLLEAETGFTYNEPSELAVTEAIEKAVEAMIVEGVMDGLWNTALKKDSTSMVTQFVTERNENFKTDVFNRTLNNNRSTFNIQARGQFTEFRGDLANEDIGYGAYLGIGYELAPHLELTAGAGTGQLIAGETFDQRLSALTLGLKYRLLPYDKFTPYLQGTFGLTATDADQFFNFSNSRGDFSAGIGAEYLLTKSIGLDASLHHHFFVDDGVDQLEQGNYNDFYLRGSVGINYYFGKRKDARTHVFQ